MSSSNTIANNSKNTAATVAPKPFCKVCRDAGRPESEYTSHFVKDQPGPNGKVICPTLLKQACRICNKPGHTSSYCAQYRSRREEPRREEPRREERYIEREQPRHESRREERYIEREQPRREERYIERDEPRRESRREERYIERDQPRREPRREERYIEREQPRRDSFNHLRDDTERQEREIRQRDESHSREQDRRSKPWLQAALKPAAAQEQRPRVPYAHPHGPRVRLNLEAPALSAANHGTVVTADTGFIVIRGHQHPVVLPHAIDVCAINLDHSKQWGDEDNETPFFVSDPEKMCEEFLDGFANKM
jgi:hypothetical protein